MNRHTRRPAPLSVHARRARSWFWTWLTVQVLSLAFVVPLLVIWWGVGYGSGETMGNVAALYLWASVAQFVGPVLGLVSFVSFVGLLYNVVMK